MLNDDDGTAPRPAFVTGLFTRDDVPLAVAVRLDDAVKAPWANKEMIKVAGILTTYILDPEPKRLNLASIEGLHQITTDAARRALRCG
jgi:hypothetical protein